MNLGFPEIAFIFVIALLLFGPKRLPEIGQQLGRALAEFKKASDQFKSQIEDEVRNLDATPNFNSIAPPENTVAAAAVKYESPDVAPVILPPEDSSNSPSRVPPHDA